MNQDLPSIVSSSCSSTALTLDSQGIVGARGNPGIQGLSINPKTGAIFMTNQSTRRLVQVFIADPNENVPLEQLVGANVSTQQYQVTFKPTTIIPAVELR